MAQPVTIRTLDIGADKELSTDDYETSVNPALGLRAVRYCLANPNMFITHLSHFTCLTLWFRRNRSSQ